MSLDKYLKIRRHKEGFDSGTVLLYFFIVTCGIFFLFMPRYMDDLWYGLRFKDYVIGDINLATVCSDIWETWKSHYLTDNSRLSNVVFVPFLLLPKWIGSGIAVVCWWYAVRRGVEIAGVGTRNVAALSVMLCLWAYCLPWYDNMGCENLQFNYIISTALAIYGLQFFVKSNKYDNKILLPFLLGGLTGSWHEGFSVPLLVGFMACVWFNREYLGKKQISFMAGLFVGFLWIFSCPVFFGRANDMGTMFRFSHLVFIGAQHIAFLGMVVLASIIVYKKKWRVFANPYVIILLVSVFVSIAIHIYGTRTPRTGWWCEFGSVLITGYMLASLNGAAKFGKIKSVVCCVSVVVMGCHQVLMDYYTFKTRFLFDALVEQYRNNPDGGAMFAPMVTEHDSPVLAWYSPDFALFHSKINRWVMNQYFRDDDVEFTVIPKELEYVTVNSGSELGGNSGVREFKSRLFVPLDCITSEDAMQSGEINAGIDFGFSTKNNVRVFYYPFISKADGKRYAYLYPWRTIIEMRLGDVRSVSFDKSQISN